MQYEITKRLQGKRKKAKNKNKANNDWNSKQKQGTISTPPPHPPCGAFYLQANGHFAAVRPACQTCLCLTQRLRLSSLGWSYLERSLSSTVSVFSGLKEASWKMEYFRDQSIGAGQSPVKCVYGERYVPRHTISAHLCVEMKVEIKKKRCARQVKNASFTSQVPN